MGILYLTLIHPESSVLYLMMRICNINTDQFESVISSRHIKGPAVKIGVH